MDKGERISKTIQDRSRTLYIFEHEKNIRYVSDGLNKFAKMTGTIRGNLYRTYKYKDKNYWTSGNDGKWRLIEVIDLTHPDWSHIDSILEGCKYTPRIQRKINDVKNSAGA
jgi:hypothetical protein